MQIVQILTIERRIYGAPKFFQSHARVVGLRCIVCCCRFDAGKQLQRRLISTKVI